MPCAIRNLDLDLPQIIQYADSEAGESDPKIEFWPVYKEHALLYRDCREWIDRVREIGAITEVAARSEKSPAILFDKIKGYSPGRRILVGIHKPTLKRQWMGDFPKVSGAGRELKEQVLEKYGVYFSSKVLPRPRKA